MTNLFLALFIANSPDSLYEPCRYSIDDNGLFGFTAGKFALQFCEQPAQQFRHLDWTTRIDQLRQIVSDTDRHVVFGSHHADQIAYLKTQLGQDMTTVAVNYTESSYDLLLREMARNHVSGLMQNTIPATQHDLQLLEQKSHSELISHYQQEFDRMQLVPRSCQDHFDYTVDIADFFCKQKMIDHCDRLGLAWSSTGNHYYDTWISRQTV